MAFVLVSAPRTCFLAGRQSSPLPVCTRVPLSRSVTATSVNVAAPATFASIAGASPASPASASAPAALAAPAAPTAPTARPPAEPPVTLIDGIEEYLAAVKKSADGLVILKVFAPWCRSCRALEPKVNRLAREFPQVRFFEMDYEKNKELCHRLGVRSMPTFIYYDGAAGEIDKFSCGPMRAGIIREKIEDVLRGECVYEPTTTS